MSGENENMSAGTIKLTNGSTAVVGTSTTFTTDLKSGDVITTTIGGVFYTLFVDTVTSATVLTLSDAFTGPTTTGAAYVAVPQMTLNRITAALAAQTAEAVRRVLQDNANWQAFYSGSGDITVTLPNGTPTGVQISGPSWAKLSSVANSSWIDRGSIGAADNINTYNPATTEGEWYKSVTTGLTTANGFPAGALAGVLKVVAGGRWNGTQIYTDYTGNSWVRGLSASWNGTNGPWGAWNNTGTSSLRTTTLDATANLNTYNGRDMDGMYRFSITTATVTDNGVPFDGFRGWIVCQQGVAESDRTSQIAYTTSGNVFTRYITGVWTGSGPWSAWSEAGQCQLPTQFSGDLNTLIVNSTYPLLYASATAVNWPVAAHGFMRVSARANAVGTIVQEFYTTQSTGSYISRKYSRSLSGGVWSAWVEEANTGNLLVLLGGLMGAGLSSQVPVDAFDWQQADFVTGQKYLVNVSTWTNAPAALTYVSGDVVDIECILCRTNANRYVVRITSQATGAANRKDFRVVIYNAKGSRAFSVDQIFTNDTSTVVGLANGGTGAATVAAARTNLDVFSKSEIGQEFINGLDLSVSGAVVTCSAGSAYVPGAGILRSASAITATASGLTANTWLHVYLYSNAGTPALDLSTSVPVAYAYPAQNKTGAGGYRYLGSFRVGAAATIIPQQCVNGRAMYLDDWAQHRVLSNGVATAATAINISTVVPTTAYSIEYSAQNASSPSVSVVMSTSSAATTGGPAIPGALAKMALSTSTAGYPNIYYQYASAPTGGLFIDVGGYSYDR